MNNKKIIAFLTSLVLCCNIIPRLNYFTLNNDITVIAETVNTDNFSCLVWEGTYNGSYNTTTKLNLRIHMTMGNGTAYVSVSEIGGTLSGSYSFTTEINGNIIIFTGTNGAVYGKTFNGIINPYTYNISGNSTNSTITGSFNLKAGINTHSSYNENNFKNHIDGINNISKYTIPKLSNDVLTNEKIITDLINPNITYFQYNNEEYNYDLSVECAKYSALAYQNYKYDKINDVFYNVKDNNIDRPYELYDTLIEDGFKDIQFIFTIDGYQSWYKDNDKDNVSFTLAHKKILQNDEVKYLTLVIIRGTDTVEWEGNMDVTGQDYNSNCINHYSFNKAKQCVETNLLTYLEEHGITNTDIVITGHSRGAAVSNLLAEELTILSESSDVYGIDKVYAYTYATPNSTLNADENGRAKDTNREYNNIYNHCLTDDFVPQVPLKSWNYNKYGVTFTNVATNLFNNNQYFLNKANLSSKLSENREIEFDFSKCDNLISYVGDNWHNIDEFYNSYLIRHSTIVTGKDGEYEYIEDFYEDISLHDFFKNYVAPAAISATFVSKIYNGLNLVSFINDSESNYSEIADYFVDTSGIVPCARYCVNDTHQMYTYYNALKVHGFESSNSFKSFFNTSTLIEENTDSTIDNVENMSYNKNDVEKLKDFITQENNNDILKWNLDDVSTWNGVDWVAIGNEYYIQSINFSDCNLNGTLDLSDMTQLNNVVCTNNNLKKIDLSNCPNLKSLNCNSSNVHILNLTNSESNLENLYIEYNYLDLTQYESLLTIMEKSISKNTGYKQQYVHTDDIATDDLENLLILNSQHKNLGLNNENIGSTNGLYWTKDTNGKYHIKELDLSYTNIVGNLDLTSFSFLTTIKLTSTNVTNVKLPKSIEILPNYAFYDCNYLESIEVANKNIKIGNGAFYYAPTSLKVYAPNNSTLQSYCLENNMRFISLENLEAGYIIGDVNENGKVDVLDKILLKQHLIEGISLTETAMKCADTNQDGNVSVEDIRRLSEIILKGWS